MQCTTESGNIYYYNTHTGESSWEEPFTERSPSAETPMSDQSGGTLVSPTAVVAKPSFEGGGATGSKTNAYPIDTEDFTDADENETYGTASPTSTVNTAKDMDDTHMAIWNKFFQNAMRSQTRQTNPLISPQNWGRPLDDQDFFEVLGLALDANGGSDQNSQSAALFASVLRSEIENVEKLLLGGASATCADKVGRTPLHHACRIGEKKIVAVLCDYGADVDFTDSQGNSPLHIAAVRGVEPVLRFLLETAARVDVKNKNGDTPLHLAVWHGNRRCCKSLLEYNANVDARNDGGFNCFDNVMARSPLAYKMPKALYKTMAYIEELLRAKGARTIASVLQPQPQAQSQPPPAPWQQANSGPQFMPPQ